MKRPLNASTSRVSRIVAITASAALCCAAPAAAQLNGGNLLGDMGIKSGSQPEPGLYISAIYYRYATDTLRDAKGNPLALAPTGTANQTIQAAMPLVYYVTPKKVLGANFAMMAVLPFANSALEAPGLGLSEKASAGLSDLYVMPAQLGWHFKRTDAVVGVGLFAPTGRYTAGASDNLGKGMWGWEVSGGGTLYLDPQRTLSVSTTAFWEAHSNKEGGLRIQDVTVSDVKAGQLLTLEGGVGKSFLHGAASVGLAYYAQWKLTSDQIGLSPLRDLSLREKHRVWAIGPDVTIPIASKTRLISLVNVRYFWERGAEVKTQGQTLMVTNTIPIGGVRIPSDR